MHTVLFTAPYMIPVLERFRALFDEHKIQLIVPEVRERMEEADLLRYAGQFDGTICGDDRYTAHVIEACAPRLKVISKWGTGVDSIDAEACARFGVKLCRTPDAFPLAVADSVMGYMLAFARRQAWMDREMKAGKWEKLPGRALHECTLGIIGIGHIGKVVTQRARAFGMRILGNESEAEDAVQQAFLGAYQNLDRFRGEAKTAFDKIVPDKTTVEELKKLGYDIKASPNVKILNYLDIAATVQSIPIAELDPGLQACLRARNDCRSYVFEPKRTHTRRTGNFWLDIFNFRRKSHETGWQFKALLVLVNEHVTYKLWSGDPQIDEHRDLRNPLGPLQNPTDLLYRIH